MIIIFMTLVMLALSSCNTNSDLKLKSIEIQKDNSRILKASENYRYDWALKDSLDYEDISLRLIQSKNTKPRYVKRLKSGRKVILFRYMSGGVPVLGYVSYKPKLVSNASILYFFRGGTGIFGVMTPANIVSMFGDETIVGTSYRGSIGPGVDERGGADLLDVKTLIDHFNKEIRPKLGISDSVKIYMMGSSRGANQMFLAFNKYPELQHGVSAVISDCGHFNLEKARDSQIKFFRKRYSISKFSEKSWLRKRSAFHNCDNLKKDLPVIIVQGGKDIRVPIVDGREFTKKLIDNGMRNVTYYEEPSASHGLGNLGDRAMTILWGLLYNSPRRE